MTDNELLLAIGDLMDKKLKSELQAELQPIKDNMQELMNRMTKIELVGSNYILRMSQIKTFNL